MELPTRLIAHEDVTNLEEVLEDNPYPTSPLTGVILTALIIGALCMLWSVL